MQYTGGFLKTAEVLDLRTGIWSRIEPMLVVRLEHGVAAVGGHVYAIAGQ